MLVDLAHPPFFLLDASPPPVADFPPPAFFAFVMVARGKLEGAEMEVRAQGKMCGR